MLLNFFIYIYIYIQRTATFSGNPFDYLLFFLYICRNIQIHTIIYSFCLLGSYKHYTMHDPCSIRMYTTTIAIYA